MNPCVSNSAPEHGDRHACCETAPMPAASHGGGHAHGHHGARNDWPTAARITLHCLTGCAIGEWIGLSIGVGLGWGIAATITLAVTLAFACGFALAIIPLVRGGMTARQALRIVWLGETVSIAVMELVMNLVDYQLGGMGPGMSPAHPQFWLAFAIAAFAGYAAALPVNKWLLARNLKRCH
ncbi:DUF4396 domain-containing protein [Sinimarinibacterium thermocellulolyticum]|uniref:DUF4396 domain-containing protein n=1 Tax=Sinimarinibacterium thermocellulolyticum TaxID=3170016 RepID=A0ABV2A9V5_9GAMM